MTRSYAILGIVLFIVLGSVPWTFPMVLQVHGEWASLQARKEVGDVYGTLLARARRLRNDARAVQDKVGMEALAAEARRVKEDLDQAYRQVIATDNYWGRPAGTLMNPTYRQLTDELEAARQEVRLAVSWVEGHALQWNHNWTWAKLYSDPADLETWIRRTDTEGIGAFRKLLEERKAAPRK